MAAKIIPLNTDVLPTGTMLHCPPKTTPFWQFMEWNPSLNETLYPLVGQINLHSIPGGQLRIPGLSSGNHPTPSLAFPPPVASQGLGLVRGKAKGESKRGASLAKTMNCPWKTGLGAAKVGHSLPAGTPTGCEGLGQPGEPGGTWAEQEWGHGVLVGSTLWD